VCVRACICVGGGTYACIKSHAKRIGVCKSSEMVTLNNMFVCTHRPPCLLDRAKKGRRGDTSELLRNTLLLSHVMYIATDSIFLLHKVNNTKIQWTDRVCHPASFILN
jgi:hypothetical protein